VKIKDNPFAKNKNKIIEKEINNTFFMSLLFLRVDLTVNKVPIDSIA
jgi:hypothetical protein